MEMDDMEGQMEDMDGMGAYSDGSQGMVRYNFPIFVPLLEVLI